MRPLLRLGGGRCAAHPVAADAVADFYKDRTLVAVVGHETGTGFDTYARVLARHFGRHVPGNPAIVVQNMVGASGIAAANWLYNVAPKDGTVVSTFVQTTVFDPIFGNAVAKFEPAKYTWIGNADEGVGICGVSKASGVQNLDDLRKRETIFGATGMTGPLASYAFAVKNLLGARDQGGAGLQGLRQRQARDPARRGRRRLRRLAVDHQVAVARRSGVGRVQADPAAQRPAAARIQGRAACRCISQIGRGAAAFRPDLRSAGARPHLFVSPPGMPAARRDALRAAFMATMKDPQFLADAAKTKIDIAPMTGEQVERFISRVSSLSPATVARAKQAMRGELTEFPAEQSD